MILIAYTPAYDILNARLKSEDNRVVIRNGLDVVNTSQRAKELLIEKRQSYKVFICHWQLLERARSFFKWLRSEPEDLLPPTRVLTSKRVKQFTAEEFRPFEYFIHGAELLVALETPSREVHLLQKLMRSYKIPY